MKQIPLTQGKVATVDDGDFEWLSQWKWCTYHPYRVFYAVRNASREGNKKPRLIYMHREILGVLPTLSVDHANGDGLDNRKINLRIASHTEQMRNCPMKNNPSGYKGVYRNKKKWQAKITRNKKELHLGVFITAEEAARAYDLAAVRYFGDFARLNFAES